MKTTIFQVPKEGLKPENAPTEFHSFHINYFLNLPDEVLIDFSIYTRIKKQTEFEYNQKFSANSKITKADIDKFAMRTAKELYVPKEEFGKANEFLNKFLLEKFKNPSINALDLLLLNSHSYEILMDVFKNSSFDKYSIEIIKEMVKSISTLAKNPEAFTIFLTALSTKKISYSYSHAYLTCVLIFLIVDKFSWGKSHSKNKIVYLSLFHDLCLQTERMVKLHHHYFEELKNLSEEEKQLMNSHADDSAAILENIVKAPKELTTLIREHHGVKHGKGFTQAPGLSIDPLSMTFVVCEELVTHYLDIYEKLDKTQTKEPSKHQVDILLKGLSDKYDKLAYREAVTEVQKFFNEKYFIRLK